MDIELTEDEALVLSDWLYRMDELDVAFEDQAERRAVWNLIAVLEKQLVPMLDPRYDQLLAEARDRVRDPDV